MDMDTYRKLTEAADRRRRADEALRKLVVKAATETPHERMAIADAAEISKATLYRWLAGASSNPNRPVDDPRGAMREALLTLLDLGAGPEDVLQRGMVADDLSAMARRLRLGLGNMPQDAHPDDEQRGVLSVGSAAAEQVLSPRT